MTRAKILPGYWHDRLEVNSTTAIFHQWEQLVASGSIENFRIAAGESESFREGWFFADSDAFKWLDAAARVYRDRPDPRLEKLMDDFISLIRRAQQSDGYINTYNQIHFPESRWTNLQVEHELYCHGHLIEAGISHFETTGRNDLLDIAKKAADRIAADFLGKGPEYTPGHQEIEIALLKLYNLTGKSAYLETAQQFIEQRGRQSGFGLSIFQQNNNAEQRKKQIAQKRQAFLDTHPDFTSYQVPAGNKSKKPWNISLRWMINAINGKYFQQHAPVREQTVPVGHSVRFAYLETAIAMLAQETEDKSLVATLESVWEHMVSRRMYVTGGIGSLPELEGFGNDYELDTEFAYTETCAALGSMFWNWEMVKLTGKAQYSDLFEWQLYNASAVGMGTDGTGYFYNNPLTCRGGVTRQAWYEIPCCPSNISRTWADLGKYLYSHDENNIRIHQYVNNEAEFKNCGGLQFKMETGLPWKGNTRIEITADSKSEVSLHFRTPSWAKNAEAAINGEKHEINTPDTADSRQPTASGFDPRTSRFWTVKRSWKTGDVIELDFKMDILLHHAHPKVRGQKDRAAVSYGPLVYCLESIDNPDVDIFTVQLDSATLAVNFDPELFGGINVITASSPENQPLTFIPYHLWGNRGASQMTVCV